MDNKDFWQQRWIENKTGRDIGYAAQPITEYINSLTDKNIKIVIPGAGNGYEDEYLHKKGVRNV